MKNVASLSETWSLGEHLRRHFKHPITSEMKLIGKFLYYTWAASVYYNGSTKGFTPTNYARLNWWNPIAWLSWLVCLVILIPICLFTDHRLQDQMPSFRVDKFFRTNPDKLKWLSHWD